VTRAAPKRARVALAIASATWLAGCAAFARHATVETPVEDAPVAPPEPTPADPPPAIAPEQEVGVELDAARRADLAAQATKDLEEAQHAIQTFPRESVNPERLQKIETVESLIQAARAAYDSDVEAAAALAHKARLLAAELGAS
jgi:hypothetical protein